MLPERDYGYLDDIRLYAQRALKHTEGWTLERLVASPAMQDAVIRCLIVIGEASGHLTKAAHAALPEFDWLAMTGMRHVLVHAYGRIDLEKVWHVVVDELPRLAARLETYLGGTG
ncbi:MAG TPA: HepT-like ribonuclease domain-containing protein [Thermoanaerobaculia bacterium]|nr:HepT-like ribonuclease domain-containing protein [Thermoanaerobaculia bacterium]